MNAVMVVVATVEVVMVASFAERKVDATTETTTETTNPAGDVEVKNDRISVIVTKAIDLMIVIGLQLQKAIGEHLTNPATMTEKIDQNRRKVSAKVEQCYFLFIYLQNF